MMDLRAHGFLPVGHWMKATVKSGISFNLNACAQDRVVYAFVVDDQPTYIGICEKPTTTLKDRMKRYKYRQGGGTNKRVAGEISAIDFYG